MYPNNLNTGVRLSKKLNEQAKKWGKDIRLFCSAKNLDKISEEISFLKKGKLSFRIFVLSLGPNILKLLSA